MSQSPQASISQRGRPRNRGGGHGAGGRGGGNIGRGGRASAQASTPTRPSVRTEPPVSRPVVPMPPTAPASRNQPSRSAPNAAEGGRARVRQPVEISNANRQSRAQWNENLLASPDAFMASLKSSSLFKQTSSTVGPSSVQSAREESPSTIDLLGGAPEDSPITPQPVPAAGLELVPAETTPAEELFKFIEGDVANAHAPSMHTQLELFPYAGDLHGLKMAEPSSQSESVRVRSSSGESSSAITVLRAPTEDTARPHDPPTGETTRYRTPPVEKTDEEQGPLQVVIGPDQQLITDFFRPASKRIKITDYFRKKIAPAKIVEKPGQENLGEEESRQKEAEQEVPGQEKPVLNETSETGREMPGSMAEQLQSPQEEFTRSVQDGRDSEQHIIGESLLSGSHRRNSGVIAPRSRTHSSTSSVTSPTLTTRNPFEPSVFSITKSRWAFRTRSGSNLPLPPHLPNTVAPHNLGAAVGTERETPHSNISSGISQAPSQSSVTPLDTVARAGRSNIVPSSMRDSGRRSDNDTLAPGAGTQRAPHRTAIYSVDEMHEIAHQQTREIRGGAVMPNPIPQLSTTTLATGAGRSSRGATLPAHLAGTQRPTDSGAAARQQYSGSRRGTLIPNPPPQLSGTTPVTGAGRSSRGPTLPAHLAGIQRPIDSGAAARQQYGLSRRDVMVPSSTHQLPATASVIGASRGSGNAVPSPTSGFINAIRSRPGPSVLNRGGLFGGITRNDDEEEL